MRRSPLANLFPFSSFPRMNSAIRFIELESGVISATYRNLVVRAKVLLVDKATGEPLAEPVTTITSPLPTDRLRIRLPDGIRAGIYFLLARNAHGEEVARSAEFNIG
jgi:hypothetical protein